MTKILMKSNRIREACKVKLEEHKLDRPYIGDQLDFVFKNCSPEKAIIIKAPTGAGKTTFVLEKIVKRALYTSKNVLILTNRNPLNIDYKTSIATFTGTVDEYTDVGLKNATQFETIYIINYQGLESFLRKNRCVHFAYVIMDECHYYMQDAPFSKHSEFVMKTIPKKFANSLRVYISATIDEVLPYILINELPPFFVDDFGILHYADPYMKRMHDVAQEVAQCRGFRPESIYDSLPMVFTMDEDYSKISLCFYEKRTELLDNLKENKTKSLIFCNTVKDCNEVAEYLDDTLVVYADRLKNEPELLKELVCNEKFDQSCMATTSVFSNGNNIKDRGVKAVAIEHLDPVEIKQMAGRRRISPYIQNDGFTLYLKIPTLDELKDVYNDCECKLAQFKRYVNDEVSLLYIHEKLQDNPFIDSICRVNPVERCYELNLMTRDKFYETMKYVEFLYALISEKGIEAYCEHVASMFGKTFDESMLFMTHKKRVDLLKTYIETFKFPLEINEFKDFCDKFRSKRITIFGRHSSDSTDSSRGTPKYVSINRRLEEFGINYKIVKSGEMFYLEEL